MKKWKLKKMSYEELGAQLVAVRSLMYYYSRGRSYSEDKECPLCVVARKYHPLTTTCQVCLWTIIEDTTCGNFVDENIGLNMGIISATRMTEWHDLRKPMLRHWAKVIQAERDCRTEGGGS